MTSSYLTGAYQFERQGPDQTKPQRMKKTLSLRNLSLRTAALLLTILQLTCVLAVEHREIIEHVIYENIHQDARTYAYYKMTIGARYYETGGEHISVKVIANQYDSDPDVFISKTNEEPRDSTNSQWFCEREGSETCIIQNGQFEIGDTFYIGVKCERECRYNLRAWFTKEFNLIETNRIQLRWDGTSTQILKYYIESETEEGSPVRSVEVVVNNEENYIEMDMHVSLDDNFYIIEEKPAPHLVENGVGFKFTEKDANWCVKCYIYIILNVAQESRYYITSQGKSENTDLSESIPTQIMVNPFTQECFPYFVLRTKQDVMYTVEGYTGVADMYISARDVPDSPIYGERIVMRGGHGTQRQIIIKNQERKDYGYSTGTYLLCFYAYTPFSGKITTLEADYSDKYDFQDGIVKTQTVYGYQTVQGRYYYEDLNSKRAKLLIHIDTQYGFSTENLSLWYKISNKGYKESELANDERYGSWDTVIGLDISNGYAQIDHIPENCINEFGSQFECTYLFSIQNKEETNQVVSMYIEAEILNPGDIDFTNTYANIVKHGQSIHYELNTYKNPDMAYLKSLKIILESYLGDADLFVSFSNPNADIRDHDFMSRRSGDYDEVLITEEGMQAFNALNRTIYFNVIGFKRTQFIVRFEYEFIPTYNQRLESAYQIGDTQYKHEVLESDYDEGFYRFRPWWSRSENRTVCFVADVLQNKIFFYSQWNDYPKHFLTTKHDVNDTIAIYGSDPDYHFTGDYYVRLRPDFALYDLMSEREYIYNMFAFSQPPADGGLYKNGFQILELGVDQVGFSNQTNYQDYKYIIADMKANFDITLRRIPGEGKPIFFVKMMNSQEGNYVYSQLPRENGYHFKSDEYPDKPWIQNLTVTHDMRVSRVGRCGFVKQSLQSDGQMSCFIAIGVMCEDGNDCAYHLKIDQQGFQYAEQSSKATPDFKPIPGNPILEEQYVNGNVTNNKVKYYYFPISREDYGNSLILLNKTQIFSSGENGDSRMQINLQANTSDNTDEGLNYTEWVYPNDNRAGAISYTLNNTWPEIIEPCEEVMTRFCLNTDGCTYIIGVAGGTPGLLSSYRIKGFRGHNKMHLNTPIYKIHPNDKEGEEAFDYYWFVLNDTVLDSTVSFEYQVSVAKRSMEADNDPDIYVSVMDGRRPTETDYDFKSSLNGADSITIASNDTFWMRNGLNTSAGVTVVVGVKQSEQGEYMLLLSSPNKPIFYEEEDKNRHQEVKRLFVENMLQVDMPQLAENETREFSQLFQLYNWGHDDIEFQLESNRGSASLMYTVIGQDITDNNIYTGIPINKDNSLQAIKVDSNNDTLGDLNSIIISGDECYNCWYLIRLESDDPGRVQFSFSTPSRFDSGGPAPIRVGDFSQIYILATLSTVRKFILDCKDNFIIDAPIISGSVEMYIGTHPDLTGPDNYLWRASTSGNRVSISVKSTDKNFHIGTYYYIFLQANADNDALLTLYLKQEKSVSFVPNNHDSTYNLQHGSFNDDTLFVKFQYQSASEDIKFHVIQVPGTYEAENEEDTPYWFFHEVKITIEALTPHFYPQVYLKKISLEEVPDQLTDLEFPSLNDFDVAFGEDPFPQLHSSTFEYTWRNQSTSVFTYYTVAVYQNNWQLSSYRKAEYQIKVDADRVDCSQIDCNVISNNLQNTNAIAPVEGVPLQNVLKLERHDDGTIWRWLDDEPVTIEERRAQRSHFDQIDDQLQ